MSKFYLTHRQDPIRCYHYRSNGTEERWQWRGASHSPQLSSIGASTSECLISYRGHFWVEGVLPFCRYLVKVFLSSHQLGSIYLVINLYLCVCACMWWQMYRVSLWMSMGVRTCACVCMSTTYASVEYTQIDWAQYTNTERYLSIYLSELVYLRM